jgi:MYXO-CTERM domain-containing protein
MKSHHARQLPFGFIALAALILPGSAGATMIYGNLGAINISSGYAVSATSWGANSFTTGSGTSQMSDVILALEGVPAAAGTLTVSLYSSTNNTPATDLATLGTIADNSLSTSMYTAQTVNVSGVTLSANTMYFIVLSGSTTGSSDGLWELSNSNIGTGVTGQYSGDYNSGLGWDISKNGSGNSDFTVKPFIMQVDVGSSTPEPDTWYGALSGLAAILATRRRRRV